VAKRGRLVLPLPLTEWLREVLAGSGVTCISLDSSIAAAAAELADLGRDPADRFIIAAALASHRRLLTPDRVITNCPELPGDLACPPRVPTGHATQAHQA
jgi:PIN domain nuclease of toxin-antitoxin system